MLRLWGLSWLTPNHHSGFCVACPLTISTKARPKQWGPDRGRDSFSEAEASQWNTEAAGMRPRHYFFASRQPRGSRHLSRGLHHCSHPNDLSKSGISDDIEWLQSHLTIGIASLLNGIFRTVVQQLTSWHDFSLRRARSSRQASTEGAPASAF